MSAIILQDEIIHYEVLGRGRPLIFLHDWVGSWRYWIPTMQAFSVAYRTYALDLWGYGDSAKNPAKYSLEEQAALLEDFLVNLAIAKVALIGHGLGAVIAILYASRRPNSVDRIVATGVPTTEESIHSRLRTSTPEELAYWLLGRHPTTEAAFSEASKADPRAITLSLSSLQNQFLTNLPGRVDNPILFIHGLNDPAIQAPDFEQLNRLPENTHLVVFEDSGHYPMLDEPSKFNRLLNDFLSLNHGASPRQLQLKEEWKRRVR